MHELTRRFDFETYFSVLLEKQTYFNLFYLFLSFPLGIAYFVITITGASLSAGLAIIGVGLLISLLLMVGLRGMAALERQQVRLVLGMPIAAVKPRALKREGIFGRIQDLVTDPYTYRAAAFALLKFPLGLASFVIAVTGVSIVGGFITAPLTFHGNHLMVGPNIVIDNPLEAAVAASVGIVLAPIVAHLFNVWAHFCGLVTRVFLGTRAETGGMKGMNSAETTTPADEIVILKETEKASANVL